MDITIIGAGNMGRGIGTRAAAGGHSVTFVDVDPEAARKSAKEIGGTSAPSLAEAKLGDVVVLALWYGVNIQTVKELGSRLDGKIVVDIANPLNATFDGLTTAPDSSSAEDVARAAAPGAKVVKAFNTTFAGTLQSGQVGDQPLDVFIAGDDAQARETVAQIVRDGGMRPVDAGALNRSRQIEGMQLLHIVTQGGLGTNWGSTLKIVS